MNRLSIKKARQVIAALVKGNSIRATVRMTGVSKDAITRLLVRLYLCDSIMTPAEWEAVDELTRDKLTYPVRLGARVVIWGDEQSPQLFSHEESGAQDAGS